MYSLINRLLGWDIKERRRTQFFWEGSNPTEERDSKFLAWGVSPPSLSLSRRSLWPIKNILQRVLGLLNVMILKEVRYIFYFQSNKVTAWKVKDGKEIVRCTFLHCCCADIHQMPQKRRHTKKLGTRISRMYEYIYTNRKKEYWNILERKLYNCFGQLSLIR